MDFVNINGTIIIPSIDAGRYCVRCGVDVHGPADRNPHICKDVAARYRDYVNTVNAADFTAYARSIVVYGGEG